MERSSFAKWIVLQAAIPFFRKGEHVGSADSRAATASGPLL